MEAWKSAPMPGATAKITSVMHSAYEGALLNRKVGPHACVILQRATATLFFSSGAEMLAKLFGAAESDKPNGRDLVLLAGDESAMKQMFPGWPYSPDA